MQVPDRSILLRCLSGDASPEEAALLDSWIQASPENRQEFDALWQLWQKTTHRKGYVPPDAGREWQGLEARIRAVPAPTEGIEKGAVDTARTNLFPGGRAGLWKIVTALVVVGIISGIILFKAGHRPAARPQVVRQSGKAILRDSLAGGTKFTLDEQSELSYPAAGDSRPDTAFLIKGKAFIQASGPMAAGTGGLVVYARESGFLLEHDSAAGSIVIQVCRGMVDVRDSAGRRWVQEGHTLLYDVVARRWTEKSSVDTNSVAFATGVFSFTNTPLKEVAAILAKAYKVSIQLNNPAIGECRMTGQFDNLPIKNVLEIIAATLNISYSFQQQGKVIFLNGRGCE